MDKKNKVNKEKSNPWYWLPINLLLREKISVLTWQNSYKKRDELFEKLWPKMEVCIANLETATLIYPEKAKPIQNILQSWFPDIYLIVKPNRKEFNDEKQKKLEELSNLQNISPIKL